MRPGRGGVAADDDSGDTILYPIYRILYRPGIDTFVPSRIHLVSPTSLSYPRRCPRQASRRDPSVRLSRQSCSPDHPWPFTPTLLPAIPRNRVHCPTSSRGLRRRVRVAPGLPVPDVPMGPLSHVHWGTGGGVSCRTLTCGTSKGSVGGPKVRPPVPPTPRLPSGVGPA